MARVLVLRDALGAADTLRELRERGHAPLLLPLHGVEPTDTPMPAGRFAGIVVTSRNAVPALAGAARHRDLRVLAVGTATATALRAAGFGDIETGGGSAQSLLAPAFALAQGSGLPLLLALGRRRTSTLEDGLAARGIAFAVWETYDAPALHPSRDTIATALEDRPPDAVLVLSGRQAEALGAVLARAPGLFEPRPIVLCLSERIAARLPAELQTSALISPSRELPALFERFETTRLHRQRRPVRARRPQERRDMPQ